MSAISKVLRRAGSDGYRMLIFWCQGCGEAHGVSVERPPGQPGPVWGWNGDIERPTFTPSVLVTRKTWTPPVTPKNLDEWKRAPWEQHPVDNVCHTFVTDGRIQYLSDCTHHLAGQTVDMVEKWEPCQ